MKRAHSPAPSSAIWAASSKPTAARCLLDEITEMAPEIQPKFLRVLEEGQVRRIGGNKIIPVSVRVVAATNRQPSTAVKEGKLRQDLFYRLNVFHLELPPLRERGEDITLLAGYFFESFAAKYQRAVRALGRGLCCERYAPIPGQATCASYATPWNASPCSPPVLDLTAKDFQQFCLTVDRRAHRSCAACRWPKPNGKPSSAR